MVMGTASSNLASMDEVNNIDQHVTQLMNTIEKMSNHEPHEVLARCGPETRSAVQSEVTKYNLFAQLVQNQANGPKDTYQQMELIKGLYKSALVRFIVATETGLVLFPIIAGHVSTTAKIIDAHIGQMNNALAAMVQTLGNKANANLQQDDQLREALQQQIAQLVQYNSTAKARMKEIQNTLV